jgi:hypothetical protein
VKGWGPPLFAAFRSLADDLGSDDAVYDIIEKADEVNNPGLKYSNIQFKGFFAAKVTKKKHVAEYFGFTEKITATSYDYAVLLNKDGITAPFFCDAQLTTTAGQPGSLKRSDNCSAIVFTKERPKAWDLQFPEADVGSLGTLKDCGYNQCIWSPK